MTSECTTTRLDLLANNSFRQLKPTNTSSQGKTTFNCYSSRLDLPLSVRMVRQGFPRIYLRVQMRMVSMRLSFKKRKANNIQNKLLSSAPNRFFYKGKLRDGPGTDRPLDNEMSGLQCILTLIVAKHSFEGGMENGKFDDDAAATCTRYLIDNSEAKARLHWIEITPRRAEPEREENSQSVRYEEFADVFFAKIFPLLHEYFGERMRENVMIICAYSHAVSPNTRPPGHINH
jgi:hypothetical protein